MAFFSAKNCYKFYTYFDLLNKHFTHAVRPRNIWTVTQVVILAVYDERLKVLELIPGLHLEVVAVCTQHAVKGALTGGETVHPEAEKQKKSIREIAEMFGVAKSTVWYILRKKECTGELWNSKILGCSWWTVTELTSMVKKNLFATTTQVKNSPGSRSISI